MKIRNKSVPGRGNSYSEGPETGTDLASEARRDEGGWEGGRKGSQRGWWGCSHLGWGLGCHDKEFGFFFFLLSVIGNYWRVLSRRALSFKKITLAAGGELAEVSANSASREASEQATAGRRWWGLAVEKVRRGWMWDLSWCWMWGDRELKQGWLGDFRPEQVAEWDWGKLELDFKI